MEVFLEFSLRNSLFFIITKMKLINLGIYRTGRPGKEDRSRWESNDHEHGRVRHNSGSHSQPPGTPHLPNTPQRMPSSYEGRDRTIYGSGGDSDRWRGERYEYKNNRILSHVRMD